jgi:hypothetical protein
MKTLLTLCVVLMAGHVSAQTITCMPMGQSTNCYGSQGQSTTITPMGSGLYSYSQSNGNMGTIYTPPAMQPVQPMQPYQPYQTPVQPLQPFHNPYAPRR